MSDVERNAPTEEDRDRLLIALADHAVDFGPLRNEPVERLAMHLDDARHMQLWRAKVGALVELGGEGERERYGDASFEEMDARLCELRDQRASAAWDDVRWAWLRVWQPQGAAH